MYLKASMNWRQRSTPTKPLMMEMNVNSRLSIHSRKDKEFHPAKLTEWVSQKEVFFIRCEEQGLLFHKSSYLCVYQPKGDHGAMYVTGCKPNIRSDDSKRFMLFRLVKLKEDEVATCTFTSSISPFIIKFQAESGGKDRYRYFEVYDDCKRVHTTDKEADASTFYLKVEKCNYFRILYKTKGGQVYYLHAPAKLLNYSSSQQLLSLSLREDTTVRSYMAFYYASDALSHSGKLHQRELSDIIENSRKSEDIKLHITCQRSVDSDSRDVGDLYVKKEGDTFSVKVKNGKTKRLTIKETKAKQNKHRLSDEAKQHSNEAKQHSDEANPKYFTGFVLSKKDSTAPSAQTPDSDKKFEASSDCKEVCTTKESAPSKTASLQTQHSSTGVDNQTPLKNDPKKVPDPSGANTKTSSGDSSTGADPKTPSSEDSKQMPQSSTGANAKTSSSEDPKETGIDPENHDQRSSTGVSPETPSSAAAESSVDVSPAEPEKDSETPSTQGSQGMSPEPPPKRETYASVTKKYLKTSVSSHCHSIDSSKQTPEKDSRTPSSQGSLMGMSSVPSSKNDPKETYASIKTPDSSQHSTSTESSDDIMISSAEPSHSTDGSKQTPEKDSRAPSAKDSLIEDTDSAKQSTQPLAQKSPEASKGGSSRCGVM